MLNSPMEWFSIDNLGGKLWNWQPLPQKDGALHFLRLLSGAIALCT